jgi:hypothetical protein
MSGRATLPLLVLTISICDACQSAPTETGDRDRSDSAPTASISQDLFVDATRQAGIDFVHFNGMSGELYYCEMMGAGVALFDYDADGDLDVYLRQGIMLGPNKTLADASFPPKSLPLTDRLYRNDLLDISGRQGPLRFTDVTDSSGIAASDYGMGVAAGDFDNDGHVDLYLTNFGRNVLLHNRGDGTFADVTAESGAADPRWSVSAAFLDFDRDGWLDLFVANYTNFTIATHKPCYAPSGARDYCGPQSYDPVANRLLRNRGDGTFEDVSARAQIVGAYGKALGVSTADFNSDGWIDIYVANDGLPNQLWINQQGAPFKNEALLAGCALNLDGAARAGMGVDAGDFDNDGDEDLFVTNLNTETNTLYVNDGKGWFEDRTTQAGLGAPSLPYTGFGTAWVDFDNDGWLDLMAVNGEVRTIESLARQGDPYPLHQRNQLFRNLGDGRFEEVSASAGAAFELSEVSRGAAFGDVDNDGDTDVVVSNNNGPARLLLNRTDNRKHWLGLRLVDSDGKRDMLGGRATVVRADGPSLMRRARADGSYASANDPRVLVGLGDSTDVVAVRVLWPNGAAESFATVAIDEYTSLIEGTGVMNE